MHIGLVGSRSEIIGSDDLAHSRIGHFVGRMKHLGCIHGRCLRQRGQPLAVDITSVCHVWVPDRSTLPGLQYTATWHKAITGVSVRGCWNSFGMKGY